MPKITHAEKGSPAIGVLYPQQHHADALERADGPWSGSQISGLRESGRFLFPNHSELQLLDNANKGTEASQPGQDLIASSTVIPVPTLEQPKGTVKVLHRWIGIVQRFTQDSFTAVLLDETKPQNPPEQVEVDFEEVSLSDRSLVAEGATFYLSAEYRDTSGQRRRTATLRFARRPKLSVGHVDRILKHADSVAADLDSD